MVQSSSSTTARSLHYSLVSVDFAHAGQYSCQAQLSGGGTDGPVNAGYLRVLGRCTYNFSLLSLTNCLPKHWNWNAGVGIILEYCTWTNKCKLNDSMLFLNSSALLLTINFEWQMTVLSWNWRLLCHIFRMHCCVWSAISSKSTLCKCRNIRSTVSLNLH